MTDSEGIATGQHWVSWSQEEYKAVKTEIQSSLQLQQQIAAFGVTLLSALSTLSVTLLDTSTAAAITMACIAPFLAFGVVAAYVGEIERMVRAGLFIAEIEQRVGVLHSPRANPLRWEQFVRSDRPLLTPKRVLIRYRGTAAILVGLGLTPMGVSLFLGFSGSLVYRLIAAVAMVAIVAAAGRYYYTHERVAVSFANSEPTERGARMSIPSRKIVATALCTRGEEVLLVLRSVDPEANHWSLPGGYARDGEESSATAVRELFEETGLRATSKRALPPFSYETEEWSLEIHSFEMELDGPDHPVAGSDAKDARWVSQSNLDSMPTTKGYLNHVLGSVD